VDAAGNLYYLSRGAGLFKVQYASNQPPVITQQPANRTVSQGQTATFSISASGTQPLKYQWQRNAANILNATSASYSLAAVSFSDSGSSFRCVISNSFGSVISNYAILTVTTSQGPTGVIVKPLAGTLYSAGQTVAFSGTASDPQQGTLPASAFTWSVDFHHDTHIHPFIQPFSGVTSGTFTIPNTGEISTNVWYRIHLTVTDSTGLTQSSYRDIHPKVVTVTVATNPSGLQVQVDGQPHVAPFSFLSVVGMTRAIATPTPQILNGLTYYFSNWSDGGMAAHNIWTPPLNTTITTTFSKR